MKSEEDKNGKAESEEIGKEWEKGREKGRRQHLFNG